MRYRLLTACVAAAALTIAVALPGPAAATPTGATFAGGGLSELSVDAGFTAGSFRNLAYRYDGCGTEPAEASCTWEVRVTLGSDPSSRCDPGTPATQLVWSSGTRSGNGSVESGPVGFGLEGCRGQVLSGYVTTAKTFDRDEGDGPWIVVGSGGTFSLFSIGIGSESVEEAERRVIGASPPARPAPPPTPSRLAVSADCRSLRIDGRRYAFVFRRMGCHKATNIARIAHWGNQPNGYRCLSRSGGGKRCSRRGNRKKYLEWHLPKRPRAAARARNRSA